MTQSVGRREFLRRSAWVAATPLVVSRTALGAPEAGPLPRVVHVHHAMAARCPDPTGVGYRNHVDQDAVFVMLDEAVKTLKGGAADAWSQVFALESPETRRLAIKINCNNATHSSDGAGDIIDAIPEPVIAVIRGFVEAGGRSSNCAIFDATDSGLPRFIATWFRQKVEAYYPDVHYNTFDVKDGGASRARAYNPRTHVTWDSAYNSPPPDTEIKRVAREADYLVNVPIVKRHSQANVTLGYKNHLGTISGAGNMHPYLYNDVPEASVLADIMGSPVVAGDPSVRSLAQKTALTVGDLLYGNACSNFGHRPYPWKLWGGEWPNCLIVSDDCVAADSVMLDVLEGEPVPAGGCGGIAAWARRYLQYAEAKGQGVHEQVTIPGSGLQRFDPAWMTYSKIDYQHVEMWHSGAELTCTRLENGAIHLQWEHYFPGLCEVFRATRPDFGDEVSLGVSPVGQYVDAEAPAIAYYQVRYRG